MPINGTLDEIQFRVNDQPNIRSQKLELLRTDTVAVKTLANLNSAAMAGKEPTISPGTTGQYWRGDKTWQTLNKAAVGLANVDNTSDTNKPVSTATQTALNAKEPTIAAGTTAQYWRGDKTWQALNKAAVGLANVDNTSDASKPVSTATQTALNTKVNVAGDTMTGALVIQSTLNVSSGITASGGTNIFGRSYLAHTLDGTGYAHINGGTAANSPTFEWVNGSHQRLAYMLVGQGGTNFQIGIEGTATKIEFNTTPLVNGVALSLVGHTHPISEIVNLQSSLDTITTNVTNLDNGKVNRSGDIVTGALTVNSGLNVGNVGTDGYAQTFGGSALRTGYMNFRSAGGAREGYIGFGNGSKLMLFGDGTIFWEFNNTPKVNGTEVSLSGHTHVVADITDLSANYARLNASNVFTGTLQTTGVILNSAGGPKILSGSGTPEGSVSAPVGSLYLRTNGGAGTSLYVKQSGTGNTGWVGK